MRLVPLIALSACTAATTSPGTTSNPTTPSGSVPQLSDLHTDHDDDVFTVERADLVAAAVEPSAASDGSLPDPALGAEGFVLAYAVTPLLDAVAGAPSGADTEAITEVADLVAVTHDLGDRHLGAAGVALAAFPVSAFVEGDPNTWTATSDLGGGVSGAWGVAWVESGWVVELRRTASDASFSDERWIQGFVAADGHSGWWDLFDATGWVVGTEWAGTPGAEPEWEITSFVLSGPDEGWMPSWNRVDGWAATDDRRPDGAIRYAIRNPDGTGMLHPFQGSSQCWDVDLHDVECGGDD